MKKFLAILLSCMTVAAFAAGCNGDTQTTDAPTDNSAATEVTDAPVEGGAINVLSREEGSGTRGAFIELFGIEEKNADGKKVDNTIETAEITNSTAVMMQTVAGNVNSIGYISLGSLNDTVTALKIDGAEATAENVKSGTYKVSRPFNIATNGEASGLAADFIAFILSDEGQAVVEDHGYVSNGSTGAYAGTKPAGSIVVGGSSSVSPVMEKLIEAYKEINADAQIDLQTSDSTTGMTSTVEGVYDIGMASRDLKDTETEAGLVGQTIATDGVAVIVNNENPVKELTSEDVKNIYTGVKTNW